MEEITFQRCTKPEEAIGDPILVLFSDGSENIFGTCAYARWQTESGSFVSSLIASKSRVAINNQVRINNHFITSEGRLQFVKTYCIVDPEIVRTVVWGSSGSYESAKLVLG